MRRRRAFTLAGAVVVLDLLAGGALAAVAHDRRPVSAARTAVSYL